MEIKIKKHGKVKNQQKKMACMIQCLLYLKQLGVNSEYR